MIGVGIGGWTFAPWRGTFYPKGLPHAQELAHASRRLTSIEINATFYRQQSRASFARWATATPEGFVLAVKAPLAVVGRRDLASAGESVARFLDGGLTHMGDRLGPILWQLPPQTRFDAAGLERFLALLPPERDGLRLRHALEVRHASFVEPAFVMLARRFAVAVVLADSDRHPMIADVTAPFVYVRLQRSILAEPAGYSSAGLDLWARRLSRFAAGAVPDDLPRLAPPPAGPAGPRACFAYVIGGAKVRAPAAAEALIARLGGGPSSAARASAP